MFAQLLGGTRNLLSCQVLERIGDRRLHTIVQGLNSLPSRQESIAQVRLNLLVKA